MIQKINTITEKAYQTLAHHKLMALILAASYSYCIIYLHNDFVLLSIRWMNYLSLPIYNKVVGVAVLIVLLGYLAFIFKFLKAKPTIKIKPLFFLLSTLSLMLLHFNIMFEMNIEIIHSLEFSLIPLLLFPVFGRFGAALICTLPLMLFDEWRQYVVLYPGYVTYLELNDVVMDILGCGLILSTLSLVLENSNVWNPKGYKPLEVFLLLGLCTLVIIGFVFHYLALFPSDSTSQTLFVFSKVENPYQFWKVHPFTKATYHIMSPIEGMGTVLALCLLYLGLDKGKTKGGS